VTKYYCPSCDRYVTGQKIFHDVAFILLCLFVWAPGASLGFFAAVGVIGLAENVDPTMPTIIWVGWMLLPVFYVLYHILIKTPRCPICNSKLRRGVEPIRKKDEYNCGSVPREESDTSEIKKPTYENNLVALQTEKDQLEQVIEEIKRRHNLELSEKDAKIRELKAAIKTKMRVEEVVHAEYTQEYFPKFVIGLLNLIDPKKKLSHLYIKTMSLVNYVLVCGIGVFINTYILYALVNLFPLWLANLCAIFTAFLWNWTLTVGPLGYLMGLSPKVKKEKVEQK